MIISLEETTPLPIRTDVYVESSGAISKVLTSVDVIGLQYISPTAPIELRSGQSPKVVM